MSDVAYSPEAIIRDLRAFGFRLFVGDDGAVHGKIEKGRVITLEMRAVIDRLQLMNDQVAAILRAEEPQPVEYKMISVEDAVKLGQRINAGELELIGKVIYHKGTGLCDITVREVKK